MKVNSVDNKKGIYVFQLDEKNYIKFCPKRGGLITNWNKKKKRKKKREGTQKECIERRKYPMNKSSKNKKKKRCTDTKNV